MSTDIAQPRAEEIIVRIVELQPWLRTQQATAEQERRIPQETIERLDAAGVFSLTKPKRYGGADFNTREMLDIYRALGAGCGASGWVVWATAGGNMWSNAFAVPCLGRIGDKQAHAFAVDCPELSCRQPARGEQPGHLGGEPWTSTHGRPGRSFIHERA
ncbi:MAG: acyl-CoA dehydrogenase family protein [Gemmatimonadaceae bacterium]